MQALDADQACALLCKAVQKSHATKNDELLSCIAEVCLSYGLRERSKTQLQLSPVSCCTIGAAIRQQDIDMNGKLLANLDSDALSPYLDVIAGPKGTQPVVLLRLAELINKKQRTAQIKDLLSKVMLSSVHPQNITSAGAGTSDGKVYITTSKQKEVCAMCMMPSCNHSTCPRGCGITLSDAGWSDCKSTDPVLLYCFVVLFWSEMPLHPL